MTAPIYHLTSAAEWSAALARGVYTAPSLESEGFIHCSTRDQLLPVANAFYLEIEGPTVLVVDPDRLSVRLAWELPDGADAFSSERFPHIYGPIPLDAVLKTVPLEKGPDGYFQEFRPD